MHQQRTATLIAGLLSGVLLDFPGAGMVFGALAPYVPLLAIGLSEGGRCVANASVVAIVVSTILAGAHAGFNMAVFVAIPCSVLLAGLLRFRVAANGVREWNPALRAVVDLTLLVAAVYMALAVMAGYTYTDGMREVLRKSLTFDYSQFDPEVGETMRRLTSEWNFLIFAFGGWLWILLTLGMAAAVQFVLAKQGRTLRPDIALRPLGGIPWWLLVLLAICLLLMAVGAANDRFNAKVVGLLLLTPYFLSGMAYIHVLSYQWRPRLFWLALIYIVLIFIQWSLFLPTIAGLYFQLLEMLDKPKKMG